MAIMKQKETTTVFVYGTLKNNYSNDHYLKTSKYLGEYKTNPKWALLDLGPYPAMVMGHLEVKGELYEVDYDTLDRLDMLEGLSVGLFVRERINVNSIEADEEGQVRTAWVYRMNTIPHTKVELLEEW